VQLPKRVQPRQRFLLETSQAVFEEGALRQVTVEAQDGYVVLRLRGLESGFAVPWGAVYHLAAARAAARELKMRQAQTRE
jgi:hypothetical protein